LCTLLLFLLINLCIFVFSFPLFRIYSIEKKQKTKKPKTKNKNKKKLPTFEAAVGGNQPPFQVAAAARQPAATHPGCAATVAKLPPFVTAVGSYRQLPWR
jgi:hypothetical protein